jgi:hypothetical protein
MDLVLFGTSLAVGITVGLTLKKHNLYLVPQNLNIAKTNREYFDNMQKEM